MKKRYLPALAFVLFGAMLFCGLAGCSASDNSSEEAPGDISQEVTESEEANVLQNKDMTVEGVYVDESYDGSSSDEDIKRLYIFSQITASSGTLEVSSASFDLAVSREDATDTLKSYDVIQNDTDGGSALSNLATSYTCTNVITKILPGSSAKLAIPFNVPSFYLQEGADFSLSDSAGISDGITFGFDVIQDSENLESIAQTADAEGYAAAIEAREDASPEGAQDIMNRLDGYEYYESVGGVTQRYSFDGDRFVASVLGRENPGTYTVKNGYLACTQDSTGWVTWIPWEASDKYENGIALDLGGLFVEK